MTGSPDSSDLRPLMSPVAAPGIGLALALTADRVRALRHLIRCRVRVDGLRPSVSPCVRSVIWYLLTLTYGSVIEQLAAISPSALRTSMVRKPRSSPVCWFVCEPAKASQTCSASAAALASS